MKTKLFAHCARGRLKAIVVLALVGAALFAHTALAQTPGDKTPAPQAVSLDYAGTLGTLAQEPSGQSDPRVTALQRSLEAVGVSPGPIDGIYGPKTEEAVAGFQQKNGLQPDGIAGPQTLGQLRTVTAKTKPQAPAPAPSQPQPLPPSGATTAAKAPAKPANHTLAVVLANALFALAVFAIARTLFRRRERQRKEVESHLIALAEEEEERYRAQRTPRSRRRRSPLMTRKTSTPWTDSTSEMGSSSTASYSWPKGDEDR